LEHSACTSFESGQYRQYPAPYSSTFGIANFPDDGNALLLFSPQTDSLVWSTRASRWKSHIGHIPIVADCIGKMLLVHLAHRFCKKSALWRHRAASGCIPNEVN
jgi:hypothetical protein